MDYEEMLFAARLAARTASDYLLESKTEGGMQDRQQRKPDDELVTEADKKSHEILESNLRRFKFPVQSEEGRVSSNAQTRWVIDPIDGTEHYARGSPLYSVAVALVQNGMPVIGVITSPALKLEYYATPAGAFCNNKKITVSSERSLERATVFVHPYRRFESSGYGPAFMGLHTALKHPRYYGSSSLEIAMVAAGAADGIVKASSKFWDIAPGIAIAKAAGATVTGFDGNPWRNEGTDIVVSNGRIHAALVDILSKGRQAQGGRTAGLRMPQMVRPSADVKRESDRGMQGGRAQEVRHYNQPRQRGRGSGGNNHGSGRDGTAAGQKPQQRGPQFPRGNPQRPQGGRDADQGTRQPHQPRTQAPGQSRPGQGRNRQNRPRNQGFGGGQRGNN